MICAYNIFHCNRNIKKIPNNYIFSSNAIAKFEIIFLELSPPIMKQKQTDTELK